MKYTDVVKKAKEVEFESMTKSEALYSIVFDNRCFVFPVDLSDIGTGRLKRTDKPILYSRWIRKAIEDKTFIEVNM